MRVFTTLSELLESYLLAHELRDSTTAYYRRTANLFIGWMRSDAIEHFTAVNVSKFLAFKQTAGRSSYYRKGLRNGLVALLRYADCRDSVRPVRLVMLDVEAWSAIEVSQLIAAVCIAFPNDAARCKYWETIIAAAWYSGLSQCDLHRITRRSVDSMGNVRTARSKTGVVVTTWIPPAILSRIDASDDEPLWPLLWSHEWFREQFGKIVAIAKLKGSFKKLRKSSGTSVEKMQPGRGHQHLANGRGIFERHYCSSAKLDPLRPEILP